MHVVKVDELPAGSFSHEIAIVAPGMPHRFEASGDRTFREIGIHLNPRFVTEWLKS
jgi:hypothetical protein